MDVLLTMHRRLLLLFLLLPLLWTQAAAQVVVTRDANGMRCGDTLRMQRVEYADAGVSGHGVTWDFSRLGVTDGSYVVPIFSNEGKVVQVMSLSQIHKFHKGLNLTLLFIHMLHILAMTRLTISFRCMI